MAVIAGDPNSDPDFACPGCGQTWPIPRPIGIFFPDDWRAFGAEAQMICRACGCRTMLLFGRDSKDDLSFQAVRHEFPDWCRPVQKAC